jgi:probable H4MPT-linked C1 transfer pathway protein
MHVLGLDIGGANIKSADNDRRAFARRFDLWKSPARLPEVLEDVLVQFPRCDALAVTMTAELADCFETKAEGVDAVLQSVEQAASGVPVLVWQTGAEFVSPEVARAAPLLVAAANWHALATWLGRLVPTGPALLVDIGSTTTDIIPLRDGVPVPQALTDCERLQSGELIYSGARRTPLCAIAHTVPFRDGYCPLAAELFATTLDVYLTLELIAEDPCDCDTANGRPATIEGAHDRLARALCCDRSEFSAEDAQHVARFLADVQQQRIAGPLSQIVKRQGGTCGRVVICGSGSFLADRIVGSHPRLRRSEILRLDRMLDPGLSESACAFAVACLGAERLAAST